MRVPAILLTLVLSVHADEVADRLAAIPAMGEPELLAALDDKEWEVVHAAVDALGERGSAKAADALVDLAVRGPARRIRAAAARSLAKVAREQGALSVARKAKGDFVLPALQALATLGWPATVKTAERYLRNTKEPERRVAAVQVIASFGEPERLEQLRQFAMDDSIVVRAAAVEGIIRLASRKSLGILRDGLKDGRMTRVMERRHIDGIRRILLGMPAEDVTFCTGLLVRSFGSAETAEGNARFARLLGTLGRKDKPVGPVQSYVDVLLGNGVRHSEMVVRSASVAALARMGNEAAFDTLVDVAKSDPHQRVRFHAMRAAFAVKRAATLALLTDRLAKDADAGVREEAAVLSGRLRSQEATVALIAALDDPEWAVAVSAAVSLGKLRDARGVDPLVKMARHKDWRRRGGALTGLGWIKQPAAVPALIDGLRDKETAVQATALEFLRHISGKALGAKTKVWREWWSKNEAKFTFPDPKAAAQQAKKYGYAVTPRDVYRDMDIVVLSTRKGGDNIQFLLEDYQIEHRIVRAASIHKAGLHPYALFVANCPGEVTRKDVERLQWYVRAGGYLFASCWALTHTVEKCFPDVVDKLPLKGQVIGTVTAECCPTHSKFVEGVFDNETSPLYELMGSHLLRVLDPERFEVLIDSPQTATRWGEGDLAGWFTVGHGTVLDSANHFDLSGMRHVKLGTEKERAAFALDHLGYTYAEVRALRKEGVFAKQPIAAKRTRDVSIFRFITTFVREKRLADEE